MGRTGALGPYGDQASPGGAVPTFIAETAAEKARLAEDAWNSRDPKRVAQAYTIDSEWRNGAEFVHGREQIEDFLTRKWARELDYRLIKEVWTYGDNRIAVRFVGPGFEERTDRDRPMVILRPPRWDLELLRGAY